MRTDWLFKLSPKWRARIVKLLFNLHPGFRSMGGRVIKVTPDLSTMVVRLPLSWRTRNALGTIYGGSLFGVTDGPHPLMLTLSLGLDIIVWDQEANIRFRRPATGTLYAHCQFSEEEKDQIRDALAQQQEVTHEVEILLKDASGEVHAIVNRTLYIAMRKYYTEKRKKNDISKESLEGLKNGKDLVKELCSERPHNH